MSLTYPAHPQHPDFWYWEARYNDGSNLLEVEGEKLHHFSDINLDELNGFVLHPLLPHLPTYAVDLAGGKRLIWLRRRSQQLSLNGDELGPGPVWSVIGWQETKNDTNFKTYLFIREDGSAFLSDDHNAV